MSTSSIPKLFQPIRVGTANLQHHDTYPAQMFRMREISQSIFDDV
jgi:hypothetical protein